MSNLSAFRPDAVVVPNLNHTEDGLDGGLVRQRVDVVEVLRHRLHAPCKGHSVAVVDGVVVTGRILAGVFGWPFDQDRTMSSLTGRALKVGVIVGTHPTSLYTFTRTNTM